MPSLQIYQFEKEKTPLYHTGHLLRGRGDVTLLSIHHRLILANPALFWLRLLR